MTIQSSHEHRKLMKSPRSVDIDITTRCNQRCVYCSHFDSAGDVSEDLPACEWVTFVQELGALAVMEVTLAGGEPFIRNDIMEIFQGIVDHRMRFSVLSNGTLITDKVAEEIAATKRCNMVQVSIDGANAGTHDSCRGNGSFHRAVEGIRHLQRHGVPVIVRVTIHHQNVHELEKIIPFILNDLGIVSLSTNAVGYFGLCRQQGKNVQLTIEDRCFAMRTLVRLSREYPGRITAYSGPFFEAERFQEIERGIEGNQTGFPGRGYLTGCGCFLEKIAVRADGVIIPCTLLPTAELGRINHDSLFKIWHNHPKLQEMRNWHKIPLGSFSFCRDCLYIPYCTGNCPAGAHAFFGKDCHPSLEGCYRQFIAEGGSLERCIGDD
jgi:SynChlorMet cassette radical SAM/SPASM protein ScmE